MALSEAQKKMVLSLFINVFNTTPEEARKELYIQFSDAYDGSIKDWKSKVEKGLTDEKVKESFVKFAYRELDRDIKESIVIEPLQLEDLDQISVLASKELGVSPWISMDDSDYPDSIQDFVNSGFSYVAKRENVILGFILAYKCPNYGGYYTIYIDTFVVSSDTQGKGVGKMLLNKLNEERFMKRIFGVKLMTQRERTAYKVYKHLGFEEMSDYVHMTKY